MTTPPAWAGWWRPNGGTWRPLVTGPSEADTWHALLDAAERGRLSGGLVVVRAGQMP